MEVIFLSEAYGKQICKPVEPCCDPCCDPCEPRNPCDTNNGGWESWLPLIILIFILCGGFSGLGIGGNQCNDPCGNNGGGNCNWILILILLFCFCGNGNDGKGGLFGGLFG